MLRGHGRDAHVDLTGALELDVEAPVLRQPLLGDVQAAHQLQAQRHRGGDLGVGLGLHMQHAVDAEADAQLRSCGSMWMSEARTAQRFLEHRLQQAHHRRVLGAGALQAEQLAQLVLDPGDVGGELLGQAGDVVARRVAALDQLQQLALGHRHQLQLALEQAADLVEARHVGRVGHRHARQLGTGVEHHGAQAPRLALGEQTHQLGPQAHRLQLLIRHAQLARHRLGDLDLGDPAVLDNDAAQAPAAGLLDLQRLGELRRLQQALLRQQVAEADALRGVHAEAARWVRGSAAFIAPCAREPAAARWVWAPARPASGRRSGSPSA
jgi:hypothetical protein